VRDLRTVFGFELGNKLKQKTVRIATVITLIIIFIATCIPTFISTFKNTPVDEKNTGHVQITEESAEPVQGTENTIIVDNKYGYTIVNNAIDEEVLKRYYPFNHSKSYPDENALREAVKNEEIKKGILITSETSYKLIANDLSMYDSSIGTITSQLSRYNRDAFLTREGIDPVKVDQAESIQVEADTEILGKNAMTGFIFAYVGMFLIYFMVILYGNSVATSVAREKNDRTMELLITNTSPNYLIWGKVLASTVVSTGQLILMILVAGAGIMLNRRNYPAELLDIISEGIGINSLIIFVVFALFGTFMYYFLYASVGALVSKVEEVNSAMAPIQFVFIAAFVLCSFSLNMPEGVLMRVISIVPFTSPMAMFIRYSMTTVPVTDLIVAVVLLIVALYFLAYLAIKIYRMGTLNYGNKISFLKAVRLVFRKAQ